MATNKAKIKIAYYDAACEMATQFHTRELAEVAAAEYSRVAKYTVEPFFCEQKHAGRINPCWHIHASNPKWR